MAIVVSVEVEACSLVRRIIRVLFLIFASRLVYQELEVLLLLVHRFELHAVHFLYVRGLCLLVFLS